MRCSISFSLASFELVTMRCWLTGGSMIFLFMLLFCIILSWFDDNWTASAAPLWCLRTTYAYKWSVGVDSGSRDISISKISACSCKLEVWELNVLLCSWEIIVQMMCIILSWYNPSTSSIAFIGNVTILLWFVHLYSKLVRLASPDCSKVSGLCWCSITCYWRCP